MSSQTRLMRLLVRVWMCGALNMLLLGCGITIDGEILGTLTLPVVIDAEGASYRIHGVFAVSMLGADAGVVRRVETDASSDAPTLELRLPEGEYSVLLEPGWTLARIEAAGDRTVSAALVSENPLAISVGARTRTHASFRLEVDGVVVAADDGTVEIDVEVSEAHCGNGVVERGEACDDGPDAGAWGACDRSCLFACSGACPLRVDPTAKKAGDGSSWEAPLTDLYAALRGGGVLWIRGGDFMSPSDPETVTLTEDDRVLGGFDGTERIPQERLSATPRTHLPGLLVEGRELSLDRVSIGRPPPFYVDPGTTGLDVKSSNMLRLVDVDVRNANVTIDSSTVRFERVDIEPPYQGIMHVANSYVSWSGGSLASTIASAGSDFADSRVVLQHLYLVASVKMSGERSEGLVVGCSFDSGGGIINTANSNILSMTRGIIVDSTFVAGHGVGNTPIDGGKLFIWNSSFVNLSADHHRGGFPTAGAVSADELEIAVSSFYQNACITFAGSCGPDVHGPARVTASLFVQEDPWLPIGSVPVDPIVYSVQPSATLSGNCFTYARNAFTPDPSVERPLLALHHPCPDMADATALESARKRLMKLVEPYRVPFYDADVARYSEPDWWQRQTVLAGACTDDGKPDPGAHHVIACAPSSP